MLSQWKKADVFYFSIMRVIGSIRLIVSTQFTELKRKFIKANVPLRILYVFFSLFFVVGFIETLIFPYKLLGHTAIPRYWIGYHICDTTQLFCPSINFDSDYYNFYREKRFGKLFLARDDRITQSVLGSSNVDIAARSDGSYLYMPSVLYRFLRHLEMSDDQFQSLSFKASEKSLTRADFEEEDENCKTKVLNTSLFKEAYFNCLDTVSVYRMLGFYKIHSIAGTKLETKYVPSIIKFECEKSNEEQDYNCGHVLEVTPLGFYCETTWNEVESIFESCAKGR